MRAKVISAYDDKVLENQIQNALDEAEEEYCCLYEVQYSLTYDESRQQVLRSALLIFEEYDEEDDDY